MKLHQKNFVFVNKLLEVIYDHFELCRWQSRNLEVILPEQCQETLLLASKHEPHSHYVARATIIASAFFAKVLTDVELSIFNQYFVNFQVYVLHQTHVKATSTTAVLLSHIETLSSYDPSHDLRGYILPAHLNVLEDHGLAERIPFVYQQNF